MNPFIVEQLKVKDMLNRINPTKEADYEGMMQVLQKANPAIISAHVSDTFKRIMYLQLIAHSVSESCSIIEEMVSDNQKKEEVEQFRRTVVDYCKGFAESRAFIDDEEVFRHNQRVSSEMFLHKWIEMTASWSLSSTQKAYAFV